MIVSETDKPQGRGRVVLQKDHADLASQLARAFGNEQFAPLEPRAQMEFLALNHDRGWDDADAAMGRNPLTGLPFSLVNTPIDALLATGPRSIAYNAEQHPYCGLLAAMHVWGLFHGRYGLSDKIVVDRLSGEAKVKADAMLLGVKEQQQQLAAWCHDDPYFRRFVAPEKLMQNYKLLQFFDTLSLYFNERVGKDGDGTEFVHVPQDQTRDCTIDLIPLGRKTYRLSPYPFAQDRLVLNQHAFEIPVSTVDVDYQSIFANSGLQTETITLVA